MKSLKNWFATTTLVGVTIIGSCFASAIETLALPKEEVLERLQQVPVFVLANSQGSLLTSAQKDGTQVAPIFISRVDALTVLENFKKRNPQLPSQTKVQGISLAQFYELFLANVDKQDGLKFSFVPVSEQVELATNIPTPLILGEKYTQGVPLFAAIGGREQGYLTITENGKRIIPFFFEKSQVQNLINRYKQENPRLVHTTKIEVMTLEKMILLFKESDNELIDNIYLIPSTASLKFLLEAQSSQ